eukprot:gene27061-33729_t
MFIGKHFDFEEWHDKSTWPNIILLEFSVNSDNPQFPYKSASDMDALVRVLMHKYKNAGFKIMPEVMIFELISTYSITQYAKKFTNRTERIDQIQSLSATQHIAVSKQHGNGFSRGSLYNIYYTEFAKFYNYPVISYADAVWPSFVRHYNDRGHLEYYPFTIDGYHVNNLGSKFAVDHMFGPFILDVMRPREEEAISPSERYGVEDLHMFKLDRLPLELAHFTAWNDVVNNSLAKIVANPSSDWTFEHVNHHSAGHYCYHTNVYKTQAKFIVDVPETECRDNSCSLTLTSLFTWNDSYIGFMTCGINKLEPPVVARHLRYTPNAADNSAHKSVSTFHPRAQPTSRSSNNSIDTTSRHHGIESALAVSEHNQLPQDRHPEMKRDLTEYNRTEFVKPMAISGYNLKGGTVPAVTWLAPIIHAGKYEVVCQNDEMNQKGTQAKEAVTTWPNVPAGLLVNHENVTELLLMYGHQDKHAWLAVLDTHILLKTLTIVVNEC